jgi:cell division protein DivIC
MSLSKRKKKSRISQGARHSMMSLVLVCVFAASGFALHKVCSNRQAQFEGKLAELDVVIEEVEALENHNERLRERVRLLKTDAGVEEVAREKLGLVKPGELAFAVVPPPPPQFVASDDLERKYGEKKIKEVDKDRGTVIRMLRHLFGPGENQAGATEQVS